MTEEIRLLHIFSIQKMFWQNRHCHIFQKRHIWFCQFKGDRPVIRDCNFLHIFIIWCILRSVVRIHDRFYCKFYIVCRKWFPIMPFNSISDVECIGISIFIILPAFCKPRHHLIIRIMSGQTIKQQYINLTVFVHRRIDPCIISGSVDQRRFFCIFCFFFRFITCCFLILRLRFRSVPCF